MSAHRAPPKRYPSAPPMTSKCPRTSDGPGATNVPRGPTERGEPGAEQRGVEAGSRPRHPPDG